MKGLACSRLIRFPTISGNIIEADFLTIDERRIMRRLCLSKYEIDFRKGKIFPRVSGKQVQSDKTSAKFLSLTWPRELVSSKPKNSYFIKD